MSSAHQPDFIDWSITDYIIDIETSDRLDAETDSVVFVQLFGQGGVGDPFKLTSPDRSVVFLQENVEQFIFFSATSLGVLDSIKIWHDGSGWKPSWHLASVTISDAKLGLCFRFPCHRWLAIDRDDGKICRHLTCTEVSQGPKRAIQTATGETKAAAKSSTVFSLIDWFDAIL